MDGGWWEEALWRMPSFSFQLANQMRRALKERGDGESLSVSVRGARSTRAETSEIGKNINGTN